MFNYLVATACLVCLVVGCGSPRSSAPNHSYLAGTWTQRDTAWYPNDTASAQLDMTGTILTLAFDKNGDSCTEVYLDSGTEIGAPATSAATYPGDSISVSNGYIRLFYSKDTLRGYYSDKPAFYPVVFTR